MTSPYIIAQPVPICKTSDSEPREYSLLAITDPKIAPF